MIATRQETANDIEAVRRINELAFGREEEADIVDQLRESGCGFMSHVATREGAVVGHILFTPATIGTGAASIEGMGLAPMAVLPE